jgi:hypothetical protein
MPSRPARVVLSIGHTGASGGRAPANHEQLHEDDLALGYATHCRAALKAAGVEVALLAGRPYRARQEWGTQWGDLYVCCHVNAGGHFYGAAFHDSRSALGRQAAESIAGELRRAWGSSDDSPLADVKVVAARAAGLDFERHWTANALNLIKHVYPGGAAGVVYEPGFIDQPWHSVMWTDPGLRRTGHALAAGVLEWLQSRGLTK